MKYSRSLRFALIVAAVIGALCLPLILAEYHLHLAIWVGINMILAVSLALVMGFTGQYSLAHAAFFGIGAYTSALLTLRLGVPVWIALGVAAVITGFFAVLVGIPFLRLTGTYLAVGTFAFGQLVQAILVNWQDVTNGSQGMRVPVVPEPIQLPGLVDISFDSRFNYYYLVLVMLGVTIFVVYRLVNSRVGRAFLAIREDQMLAQSLGVHLMRYKVLSFAISCFFAGVAGALYGYYIQFISPDQFSFAQSTDVFMIVIIGGSGSIVGPLLGTIFLIGLPEFLHFARDQRMIIYGVALILVVLVMPSGVASLWKDRRGIGISRLVKSLTSGASKVGSASMQSEEPAKAISEGE